MSASENGRPPDLAAPPSAKPTAPTYVHDAPWRPGEAERLGRRGFAARIARTLAERRDTTGLVVALYGAWGEGKTSVLEMVRDDLRAHADVVTVAFNPWRFADADDLVQRFFHTLAETLGAAAALTTRREVVGGLLRDYGKLLKAIPVVGEAASGAAEAAGDKLGEPTLDALRTRVEGVLREATARVVVFVDDVDRLDAAEIRALVRLAKLTAGFERVTYVLAFDPDVVAAALAGAVGGAAPLDGRRYLEKIVQVPLQLPAADQDTLFRLMLENLNDAIRGVDAEFSDADQQAFLRYVGPLFGVRRRTIREGKRYANAAGFALPIVAGEVNTGDFLLLEALRAWYPDVYAGVRDHKRLFVGGESERVPYEREGGVRGAAAKAVWDAALAGLDGRERGALEDLLAHIFPYTQGITRNMNYGSEWQGTWARGQRAAARTYFDRYFQYAVPERDVGDRVLADLERALAARDLDAAVATMRAQTARGATERLIDKLWARVDALDAAAAETLARALAATGDAYGTADGMFGGFLSPESNAARALSLCLRRLPGEGRAALARDVVRTAEPLRFAAACYRVMRSSDQQREAGKAPLTPSQEAEVGATLGARLEAEHQREPLYRRQPVLDARMPLVWWGELLGRPHAEADLRRRFSADAREAAAFLLPFRSHGTVLETGLPTADVLDADDYRATTELVNPAAVLDALARVYGRDLGAYDEYAPPAWGSVEEATAQQFAFEHRRALARAAAMHTAEVDPDADDRDIDEDDLDEAGTADDAAADGVEDGDDEEGGGAAQGA